MHLKDVFKKVIDKILSIFIFLIEIKHAFSILGHDFKKCATST